MPNETAAKPFTLQDVQRSFFQPSEIDPKGVEQIKMIAATNATVVFNGDWATGGDFPASHGLFILPIGEEKEIMKEVLVEGVKKIIPTGDKERVNKMVACLAVPTLDSLLADEKGKAFLLESALAKYATKVRNLLVRADNPSEVPLPLSVEDFITAGERGIADQGLRSYRELAPLMVKALSAKNITVNVQLLREILQSSAFAAALMPKVKQDVWVKILETFKTAAAKKQMPVTVFDHWLETRDQASVETAMDDIDITLAA